jgi:Arc/MetJ-type ribon-helix-helix transcriptional regulator
MESVYTVIMAKQLIVELDEPLARELERVAPARSRQRSSFVRAALRRALDEAAEARLAAAYKAQPDREPAHFDPRTWEPGRAPSRSRRRRR